MTTYRYSVKTENPMTQKSGTRTVAADNIQVEDGYVLFYDQDSLVTMLRVDHVIAVTRRSEVDDDQDQNMPVSIAA